MTGSPPAGSASSPTTSRRRCCSPTGSSCSAPTPARSLAEIPVPLQRPRDRRSPVFAGLVDQLYGLLTGRETEHAAPGPAGPTAQPLPVASVGGLAGLVEIVDADGGRVGLPDIAAALNFEIDDLLPLVDAAAMLGFLNVAGGDLILTPIGKEFTTADTSANFRGQTRVSHRGRPALRAAAWRAAWGALPHNPVLGARFTHLITRERDRLAPGQARVACAATLLRWLYAIVTRRESWNPDRAAGIRAGQAGEAAAA